MRTKTKWYSTRIGSRSVIATVVAGVLCALLGSVHPADSCAPVGHAPLAARASTTAVSRAAYPAALGTAGAASEVIGASPGTPGAPAAAAAFDDAHPTSYPVTTLAGAPEPGFADGPNSISRFSSPRGLAVDEAGTVYVADAGNHRIRRITSNGVTATVAGSGRHGFADGPADQAEFDYPTGVTADGAGTLYVADAGNNRIRTVAPDGTVTTLAGTGDFGATDGPADRARFSYPTGVAVDGAGVVYVADSGNHRIRRVSPDGTVTTLAGTGAPGSVDGPAATAQFHLPQSVAVDAAGTLYVSDFFTGCVRMVAPDGSVTTLASSCRFGPPAGVSVDATGTVYIAAYFHHQLGAVTADRRAIIVAGSGLQSSAYVPVDITQLRYPAAIAVDVAGIVYAADRHRIRQIMAGDLR